MSNASAVIDRILSEHHSIRGHVKLAGDTINDIEALITLQKAHAGWSQSSIATLAEKQNQMQQAVSFLEQGLKNHFAFEEKNLPSLLGDLLMKAIQHEHHEISRQIESAKTILSDTKFETLEHVELISQKSEIQEAVSHLRRAVEGHAHHEETILNMMKKALGESDT